MKKIFFAVVILVAIAVGFSIYNSNQGDKNQTTDIVKIGYKKSVPSFPIFVGINEKFFNRKNIQIEPVVFESTNQMIEAIVRGDIDASAVGAVEPALAAEAVSPGNFNFTGKFNGTEITFLIMCL